MILVHAEAVAVHEAKKGLSADVSLLGGAAETIALPGHCSERRLSLRDA